MNIERVKELLKEKDFTMKALSEKAQIGQSTVTEILNGTRKNPTATTVKKIAEALGVSIAEIF